MSDLVLMDNTCLDMIAKRRALIAEKPTDVIGFNPVAGDAVRELYLWVFGTYLPKRYPSMFSVASTPQPEKSCRPNRTIRNLVTQESIELDPVPKPLDCLKLSGSHVDCEFALLLPESNPQAIPFRAVPTDSPREPYHLQAFILAFPPWFTPSQKLGLPLAGKLIVKS
jgi:hypothetical protein